MPTRPDQFNLDSKIYVAGHTGLVGSAVVRALLVQGFGNICTRSRAELDLTDARATDAWFEGQRPEYVVLAAAKVGGIVANDRFPADFVRINLQIQTNVLDAAHRFGVRKLLFLGSSCIYPRLCPQPIAEESLLTGPLEPTNEAYAIAKIAGILGCHAYNRQHGTNFIAAMPTNLYGPGDSFDLATSHVVPAMIRKFHEAREEGKRSVELWGTGKPRRELLFVDDLADALLFLLRNIDADTARYPFVNVGTGQDMTIAELAEVVRAVVGYKGEVRWNAAMPDGAPRKLLDVSRVNAMGWRSSTPIRQGLERTVEWYLANAGRENPSRS